MGDVQGGLGRFREVKGSSRRLRKVQGGSGSLGDVQGDSWRFMEVQGGSGGSLKLLYILKIAK